MFYSTSFNSSVVPGTLIFRENKPSRSLFLYFLCFLFGICIDTEDYDEKRNLRLKFLTKIHTQLNSPQIDALILEGIKCYK